MELTPGLSARPVLALVELGAYAVGNSSLVAKALADGDSAEAEAAALAVAAAEGFGARWLGYDADGLHVHRRLDPLFVLEPLAASGVFSAPYAHGAARPVVQLVALGGQAVDAGAAKAFGDAVELAGATPGAYVSVDTFCGYRPAQATLQKLQAVDGLGELGALPPQLPGPLRAAVAEAALAVVARMEAPGALGLTERSFNVTTQVASSARLVQDVMRGIWETHARAYRVLS